MQCFHFLSNTGCVNRSFLEFYNDPERNSKDFSNVSRCSSCLIDDKGVACLEALNGLAVGLLKKALQESFVMRLFYEAMEFEVIAKKPLLQDEAGKNLRIPGVFGQKG